MSNLIKRCASNIILGVVFKNNGTNKCYSSIASSLLLKQNNNYNRDTRSQKIRSIFTSPTYKNIKIVVETKENETHVHAVPVPSGREGLVVDLKYNNNPNACALCRLNLRNLDYTDVMILSQWIKEDGSLATYEESKLCTKQYKNIQKLIKKAQRCNLIRRPADYFVPGGWHDLNTYLEPDRRRDQPMKVVRKEYWKL